MRVSTISLFTALAFCSVLTACGGGGSALPGGNSGGITPPPVTPPQTQTCGQGVTAMCDFGCTDSAGADVDRGDIVSASETLTCKPEPTRTCTCTHGCTVSGGDDVKNGDPAPASATLTCKSAPVTPPPATQTCMCTHGCTVSGGDDVKNGDPAPASAMLACKSAPQTLEQQAASIRATCPTDGTEQKPEFCEQTGLRTIKNEYALALDATGQGVTIGISDTGFDHLHPDLGKALFHDKSILAYPVEASDVPTPEEGMTVHSSVIDGAAGTLHEDLITGYVCAEGGFGYADRWPEIEADLIRNCQSEKLYIRQPDPDNPGNYLYYKIPTLLGDVEGTTRHGTAVASVAVAQREENSGVGGIMGVAPGARLLALATVLPPPVPLRRYSRTELPPSSQTTDPDIEFLAPISQVINFSHGIRGMIHLYTEAEVRTGLSHIINSARDVTIATGELRAGENPLYVWAAGNFHSLASGTREFRPGGASHPSVLAGLPYHIRELRGRWLAATAVSDGSTFNFDDLTSTIIPDEARIARFANRCGPLPADWITDKDHDDYAGRHYCIAAPGNNLRVLLAGAHGPSGVILPHGSGTSYAAPHVSGALAVLIGHFDTLSLKEILIRLVDSANNRGDYLSRSELYGAGLLDLEAALRPMGEMRATMGSSLKGASLPLAGSQLTAGAAYGDALSSALEQRTMAGFDDYHAPFSLSLPGLVTTPRSLSLEGRRDRLASFTLETVHPEDGSVRLVGQHGMAAVLPLITGDNIMGGETHLFMAHRAGYGLPLGLRAIETTHPLTADPSAFSNPFLGLAEQGVTVGMGQHYGDGVLRMAAFTGTGLTTNDDGLTHRNTQGEAHGVVVDYAVSPTDETSLSLQAGALMEDGQILGLSTEGAFGTPPPVPALFSGITLAVQASDTWTFMAQAYGGVARPEAPSLGMVKSTSPVIASAFSAGLTGGDVIKAGDQLSFIISQPLRVEAGEMGLSWATGRTIDGRLHRTSIEASLTPSGREITLGVGYSAPLSQNITTELRTGLTRHPGHNAATTTELFSLADFYINF